MSIRSRTLCPFHATEPHIKYVVNSTRVLDDEKNLRKKSFSLYRNVMANKIFRCVWERGRGRERMCVNQKKTKNSREKLLEGLFHRRYHHRSIDSTLPIRRIIVTEFLHSLSPLSIKYQFRQCQQHESIQRWNNREIERCIINDNVSPHHATHYRHRRRKCVMQQNILFVDSDDKETEKE